MFHPALPLFHVPLLPDYPIMRDPLLAELCSRLNPLSSIGHGSQTSDRTKFLPDLSSPLPDTNVSLQSHRFLFDPRSTPSLPQFSIPSHYFTSSARFCSAGSTFNMAELFPAAGGPCPLCIAWPANFPQAGHHHVHENPWRTMEASSTPNALSLKYRINHPPLPFPPTLMSPWKPTDTIEPTTDIRYLSTSALGKVRSSVLPPVASLGKRRCIRCRCPNCLNPSMADRPKGSKRKHICHFPGCRKVYGKTSHLRAHLRWHVGDRPFRCRWLFCRKSFTRSDELQRHLKTHTGDKKFLCRLCCKRFMRSDHLKKHLKTHQVRDTLAAAASASAVV